MNPLFRFGAIFDWDGVIIDSSSHHEESWKALVSENGKEFLPDFFLKSFGMKNDQIIPRILGWTQDPAEILKISHRKEELYREIVQKRSIEALPGAVSWVKQLESMGIPRVIASSTHRKNIELGLQLIGLEGCFTEIVSAEDVVEGKPHPSVFLKASEKTRIPPGQCIVFEDAHVGIEAARRAGIKVIALQTTHPKETLLDADEVIENLEKMTLEVARKVLQVS
jgi:HAD superfamily hydrolase (TIGR01509 family)